MKNFEFYNPVKVIFGKDQLSKLSKLIPKGNSVLMLYGGGSIKKNGVYNKVKESLKDYTVFEFGGIEPNPHYETAMKAVELIQKEKIDFLLAVGGGSVIDATKFIAAAALYTAGDPWDILSKDKMVEAALPLGSILTLPATGSEMNANAVVTRVSSNEKFAFNSPLVYPKFSFLLPDAAGFLPRHQVANGIVDAFVHVVEQYLTFPVNAPLQDRMAESILQTLVEVGPTVYHNPADYEAMSNLMWCATMALNGLISCGVPGDWSVHTIGHELTAIHNIDHARTLAVVLPGLWSVLKNEKREKLLQYGARVLNITAGTEDERIENTILKTVEFFESLGIKTRLADYNVTGNTIDKIVKRFEDRGWKAMGDRNLITPNVVRKVLEHQLCSR
ncbi:MAG: iron-containing alcohol dehydrogenase [Bacteroidota bacterium]|nr:iron-containing alcohol dehydrogenase [Bacteroidota bacterium]